MWGRVPPKHWAHLQVIDCALREDARHTAAAVVDMWDAYGSILLHPARPRYLDRIRWNWDCVKSKASAIGTASKASPAPLPSPSAIRKRSPSLALLYAVRKARPQSPSLSSSRGR